MSDLGLDPKPGNNCYKGPYKDLWQNLNMNCEIIVKYQCNFSDFLSVLWLCKSMSLFLENTLWNVYE